VVLPPGGADPGPTRFRGSGFSPTPFRTSGFGASRVRGSGFSRTPFLASALLFVAAATPVIAAPVEIYREGDRYCSRKAPPGSPRIDRKTAERIALELMPDGFCGPASAIGGCDVETENFYDSWRVYVHQYRRTPGVRDWAALTHSYVILDALGNCLANIPGTEPGAPR
jgi:hypothetical protein